MEYSLKMSTEDVKAELEKIKDKQNKRVYDTYFKYCNNNNEIINGIFKDNKIRFTQPRELNDPLEFNPTMRFKDTATRYQCYDLKGIILPSIASFFRVQLIESQINKYGMLSLTKIPDSFDMWSQYANGHRGFVIEFKDEFWLHPCMKSKSGEEYKVKKVNYVEDYSINIEEMVKDNGIPVDVHFLDEMFFRKTSRWKHENEYRMVRPLTDCPDYRVPNSKYSYSYSEKGIYLFPFNWECISSIILGANMTSENKRIIDDCCRTHDIAVFQALIVRDITDRFGIPGFVWLLSFEEQTKEKVLDSQPQLHCTDCVQIGNKRVVKINNLSELPYYDGYEDVIYKFYQTMIKDRTQS